MNSNQRIVIFIISSFLLYTFFSILGSLYNFNWTVFKRINLISEIISKDTISINHTFTPDSIIPPLVFEIKNEKDFTLYSKSNNITDFNSDSNKVALSKLMHKLADLKKGNKRKIRIAYFGDSMIEGDLLTQTFRQLFQKEFGGCGVGFVPIKCPTSKFRQTVTSKTSGGWKEQNFKSDKKPSNLFLSGYLFRSNDDWVEMTDRTITDNNAIIEKYLFYGNTDIPVLINVNGSDIVIPSKEVFGKIILNKENTTDIKITSTDIQLPIYGISFESESGIIIDNFSFRGISGVELNTIDTAFLNIVAEKNNYDLIIFQYGVNVLFRPHDKVFNWYARMLKPVIQKFKHSFNNADIIIVSTADRAFRYDGEYKSAEGIDSLIKAQAVVAYENEITFYNQFETMGGHNSIVAWANAKPSLANKDYIHPNLRGAEVLATNFFNAIIKDYNKYLKIIK